MRALLVGLGLLALLDPALGADAWVLWNDVSLACSNAEGTLDKSEGMILIGVWPTYEACGEQLQAKATSLRQDGPSDRQGPEVKEFRITQEGNIITQTSTLKDGGICTSSFRLFCLPDTTDPREPKSR